MDIDTLKKAVMDLTEERVYAECEIVEVLEMAHARSETPCVGLHDEKTKGMLSFALFMVSRYLKCANELDKAKVSMSSLSEVLGALGSSKEIPHEDELKALCEFRFREDQDEYTEIGFVMQSIENLMGDNPIRPTRDCRPSEIDDLPF
jgi:hypothetical protein